MNGGKLVDERERRRAANDLDSSLCVEAGAGTGKTTLLVDRYLSIISSGRARCVEIVAITFTEKAAGEMKYRLRREMALRIREEGIAPEVRSRLEDAYTELERAPISTIHAFAAMILREHPLEAGVDPFFGQLDAVAGPLFLDQCWNDFLAATPEAKEPLIARFLSMGGSLGRLHDMAFALYDHRGDRHVDGIFASGAMMPGAHAADDPGTAANSFMEGFKETAERLEALAGEHCVDRGDNAYAGVMLILDNLERARGLSGEELEDFLIGMPMPKKNAGSRSNWSSAAACTEVKGIIEALRAAREEFGTAIMERLRDGLSGWFDEFVQSAERRKRTEGQLDFDDLLIRTRELLGNSDLLRALRERYRFILVDEFQDTDPLQAEIVFLLAGDEPGRLFVVGDPKQSIYRFRRADVEIYEEVKERLAASGAAIHISQNFRSVPPLVDWVNDTFARIITPPDEGRYQPRYEPIAAAREGVEPSVIDLDLELADGESNVSDIRRVEAEAIGRLMHDLLASGRTVRDQWTREPVPISYKHIAVVYPGTTGIDFYEETLRREGIPYIIEGGKLYYTRQEVRDVASALWAVENPYDPVALVAILRSPLFGFSDEELFLFRASGGSFCYLDPGVAETEPFDDLFTAFRLLADLRSDRNAAGPAAVLRTLLRETNFLEFCLSRPNGDQRVQNIRKILQNARAFEHRNLSFRSFARWLKDREALVTAEAESPLVEEDEDAVRLLTIHKAKGLQFPVVVLANLSQQRSRKTSLVIERGGTIQFKTGVGLRTGGFDDAVEFELRREEAESARLLYVAATRAGDILVVPRMPETKRTSRERSYFHLLEAGLRSDNDGRLVERSALSALPPLTGSRRPFRKKPKRGGARERERWARMREELVRRAARTEAFVTPSGEEERDMVRPAIVGTGTGEEGRVFGLAFHRLMEMIDPSADGVPDSLARAAAAEFRLPEVEGLLRVAGLTLSSDLLGEARASGRMYREVPFTFVRDGLVVEGRIDLMYRTDGGWRIVDYKTDDLQPGDIDARFDAYRRQGMIYALAASRLVGEPVESVLFFFVRSGEMRDIRITGDMLDRFEAELSIRSTD
jgi:ATP-dependent helicase/nuclease subunit A